MIALSKLAEEIQNTLNAENTNLNYTFNIVADTAQFKGSTREDNQITQCINGVLVSGLSEITNLVSGSAEPLIYATQSATLKVIMPIRGKEEDREFINDKGETDIIYGYKSKLEQLRSLLNSVFQGIKVFTMNDADGKEYSVTAAYQLLSSGNREIVPVLGDSFSYIVNIYYSFVENGINTRDVTFKLDGVLVPYQSMTIYRTPTMDGNVYANTKDGSTKNIASQSTLSISFELPAFRNEKTTSRMLKYLLKGPLNQAHILSLSVDGEEEHYLVSYGETKLIGETIKNAGQTLTLVECPDEYDLICFNEEVYDFYFASSTKKEITIGDTQAWLFEKNSSRFCNNDTITIRNDDILIILKNNEAKVNG